MKHLTTFIYGLLLILLGISGIMLHKSLDAFSDYAWCALGFATGLFGFFKIEKSIN